jgi:anti-sigma regulatory factor (Ser/Thr protein kinase)
MIVPRVGTTRQLAMSDDWLQMVSANATLHPLRVNEIGGFNMTGVPGTVTGPGTLPGGPEIRSSAGDAFHDSPGPPVSHRSYLELPAEPVSVPRVRRHTRQTLAAWQLGHIAGDTELIVSELITNAIAATLAVDAAAPVALYLAADDGRLYVLVWDCCPQPPAKRPHDDDAEAGRGLQLVAALAERWGACLPVSGGKAVFAWLSVAGRPA